MSIIKLANEEQNRTVGDYVIPSAKLGAGVGAGLVGVSSLLPNKSSLADPSATTKGKSISSTAKRYLKKAKGVGAGVGAGALVGGASGVAASPIARMTTGYAKKTGDFVTPEEYSDHTKMTVGSGIIGAGIGGGAGAVARGSKKSHKGRGRWKVPAGAALGAGVTGMLGAAFDENVQKGINTRNEKKKRREEYNELKQQLKEE